MRRLARFSGLCAAAGYAALTFVAAKEPVPQLAMAPLLDRYAAGDVDPVVRRVVEAEATERGSVLRELRLGGERWIGRAETRTSARRRRLVAAALALETAAAPTFVVPADARGRPGLETLPRFPAGASAGMFEQRSLFAWAVSVVLDQRSATPEVAAAVAPGRTADPLDDAERRWFLAALSWLCGTSDVDLLAGLPEGGRSDAERLAHLLPRISVLDAARARFPDEPRFRLIEAFAEERRTTVLNQANVLAISTSTPEDGLIQPSLFDRRPDPAAVAAMNVVTLDPTRFALTLLDGIGVRYESLAAEPSVRAEALLRLGYHQLRLGDRRVAAGTFSQVIDIGADPDSRYLALFFRGWARHRDGLRAEAEADYAAALRIHPASRQVRTLLAGVLADRGARAEARDVLGDALGRGVPPSDPWTMFHRGDYRFWPDRVVAMREALR
jgi:hypothetical protein